MSAWNSKRLALAGQWFGDLYAIRDIGKRGAHRLWLCHCRCGETFKATAGNLNNGQAKSCGCMKRGRSRMDIAGQWFGDLFALRDVGARDTNRVWLCLCRCGRTHKVKTGSLRAGHTKSCGCRRKGRPPINYREQVVGLEIDEALSSY